MTNLTNKIYKTYKKTKRYAHIASLLLDWFLETAWYYFSKIGRIFLRQPFFAFLGKRMKKLYLKIEPSLFKVLAYLWKKWIFIKRKANKKKWSRKGWKIFAYVFGLVGFVAKSFWKFFLSLSTWKRVFAALVIFTMLYQNIFFIRGVSASEKDPIEDIATPEMRMLSKVNPDLMKTDVFQKRKELTEFSKEKAGEVNYYLGLIPKTKEDSLKKKEAELLIEAQDNMKDGWFSSGETLEKTIIEYANEKDEKTRDAAKNLIQALKEKNLWGSFTDGTTGQEKEISPALLKDGGDIKTAATPYEMIMNDNYSGMVKITDTSNPDEKSQTIGNGDQTIPEPKISKVNVGSSEKIMVDKTPQFQEQIEMRPVGANPSKAVMVDNKILFKDAFTGMDVVKSSEATKLKEDVIIKNSSASSTLSYKLKTTGLDMRIVDGKLQFFDIFGNLKFTTDKPFIVDKNGNRKDLEYTLGGGDLVNQKTFANLNGGVENQEEVDKRNDDRRNQEEQEAREWNEAEKAKNSPGLRGAAEEIGNMLQKSADWVLNLFSISEIEQILGRRIIDEKDQFNFKESSLYQDAKKTRYYTVSIKMDFSEMSYPIDLDPTINVNLEDQGQATFFGDYADGSTSGTKGFMNGYGSMTRSSEPFLPQGSFRGYWPMDGDSIITTDYSGSANTLTNNGTMVTAGGKFSGAGIFNGSTQYLSIVDNASLSVTGALTFGAWFKTNSASTNQFILSKNGSYRLEIEATGKILASLNGTAATRETSSAVNTSWHHIMAVYNPTGTTLDVYLDGVLNNGTLTGTVPGSLTDSAGAFNIGADATANKFNGYIDEATVWARNLSATEIAGIYNNGRVENTDSRIMYVDSDGTRIAGKIGTDATTLQTNSIWFYSTSASYSNGSAVYYNAGTLGDVGRPGNEKANIEYVFTGTEIWGGFIKNSVLRFIKTTIDEGTVNEITTYLDLYNSSSTGLYKQKILIATGLTNASHTVRVYPLAGKDITSAPVAASNSVYFDYFEYYTTGYELAQKSAITINSRATNGLDFAATKDSPAVSYDARGNIPANASGTQEKGTWSSWVKTDFAWNADNAPHHVWSNENARLYYLYDGSTNGNWYFDMYNGTNWTTVQVKSANYTVSNTFASGDVFHLAVSWDAAVGTNLYVNNVKTSYAGTWTAQALTGNMKVGGDEKTKLLLHADGPDGDARDIDASGNGYPLTFNTDAKISTTQSKFGSSSYYFDGVANTYILVPDNTDLNMGTGDFTFEYQMYVPSSAQGNHSVFYGVVGGTYGWAYGYVNNTGGLQIGPCSMPSIPISYGSWQHIVITRQNGTTKAFVNGTQQASCSDTTNYTAGADFLIGANQKTGGNYFIGYLDEIKITKGRGNWTSNFTSPTGPYHSNMIIAEPTILNYVLTDAEVNAIYASPVSMGEMINGAPGSAAIDTQKKLFSAAKRSEEVSQTSKSLLFNYSGVQTADARVGAGAGSLYKTTAPTNPSTTVAEAALTWSGNWTDAGNYRSTTDTNASAVYTTSAAATEIWVTYYANTDKGIAEYIIDEGTAKEVRTKVDQYKVTSAEDRYALIATGLENTTHTIRVRMLNSRNPASTGNGIIIGLNGTADRMFYFGATPDIATQTMVVNGKTVPNVLVQDYATVPTAIQFSDKGNISESANEGSVSAWVATAWAGNDSVSHYLIDSRNSSFLNGLAIVKDSSNYLRLTVGNGSTSINLYSRVLTAADWAPNIPHHIVTKWWRPTSTTFGTTTYLDGKKVAETKSQAFTPTNHSDFNIGNAYDGQINETNDFDGAIYDLSVWSWAFDDGGIALGGMASPTSDVGKSYSGYALGTDEDLSAQVTGAATTFKLKEKLERTQPNDTNWIWAENRKPQTYFGYNMAYDSVAGIWYTVQGDTIYYSSGSDPEKSTWAAKSTGLGASYTFSYIYHDNVNSKWYITLSFSGDARVAVSDSDNPLTAGWTTKSVQSTSEQEFPSGMAYDSINSRWYVVGYHRISGGLPYRAWLSYSSGSDLAIATWTSTYISNPAGAGDNQQPEEIIYDSGTGYWYITGGVNNNGSANNGVIWYGTDPTGGPASWTRMRVSTAEYANWGIAFDSTNSRYYIVGLEYNGVDYDIILWVSSGNNLVTSSFTKFYIDKDSDNELNASIVKDPNSDKYYLSSYYTTYKGFWTMHVSSEETETLPNSISVKSEGAAATVSSAKTGTFGALETAIDQDDASLEIKKTFYEPDSYDKLLIHSDTTDGTASFGDSTTGKTITVAGNTHHEKDQAKIGQTSIYFDGTGDYLSLADSDDWNFGSGDFTVDTWIYATSWDNYDGIVAKWHSVTDASRDWAIIAASGVINFAWHTGSTTGGIAGLSALSTNAWHHIAAVRNGSDIKLYVDGTEYATGSITTIRDSAVVLDIGSYSDPTYYFNGYIDEVRISKGIARWTAAFDPLDPIDESEINTSGGYLTVGRPGSNRKPEVIEYSSYDASTNVFTLAQRGDNYTTATSWPDSTPIKVGGTVTLSAAPASGAKVLATYNYQGEELDRDRGQIKSKLGQNNFLDYTASVASGWALSGDTANKSGRQTMTTQVAGQNSFGYFYGAELGYIFSGDTTNGGVAMIVVDEGTGNERRIRSDQNNSATNQFYDQLFSGLSPGYHTFRIISGVDETNSGSNKYGTFDGFVSGTKSDLSLPTTGLSGSEPTSGDTVNDTFYYPAWKDQDDTINTRDSNTKLLLHADGANNAVVSYDSALPQKTLTHSGDAKISTTQSKFGGSSYSFDGTGDYISAPDSDDWNFGAGDFTIDFWARYSEDPNTNTIGFVSQTTDANNRIVTSSVNSGGQTQVGFAAVSGGVILANYYYQETLSTNTWYHFAFVRQGTNVYMFRDGVSKTLTASTPVGSNSFPNLASSVDIGRAYNASWSELNGFMDEVRITKGVARWTSSFTVPDKPYGGFALTADITSGVTSLTLDSENPSDLNKMGPNGVVKIGSEYIRYESKGVSGNQATLSGLTRAYAGSTAGAHSNNDAVYPTGGWRNNYYAQQSSWYRENGAFPEKALIVGTGTEGQVQGGLTIVNLDNNTSWGRFEANANNAIISAVKTVSATNGKIFVGYGSGGGGMTEFDFLNDRILRHKATAGVGYGAAAGTKGSLSQANDRQGWSYTTDIGLDLIGTGGDYIQDIESYFDGSRYNVFALMGKSGTTGTSAGISYLYDGSYDGKLSGVYDLTSDTNYWGSKLEYDSTNDVLYGTQTNGTANQDIWSKIVSPRIGADSTIDAADGTTRMTAQSVTEDMAQDASNVYFATAAGVKKVLKSTFSSVSATFNSSNLTSLLVDTARTVDYDSAGGKLVMGFSGISGHDGALVVAGTDGSSPSYLDYFGETSLTSNNSLVSDIFNSVSWANNLVSGYYSFAVGTNQGISLIRYLTSETPGGETGGGVPKPPAINSDAGFLVF